jgi:hypothetical protein
MPVEIKILTRQHIAVLKSYGYQIRCAVCGKTLKEGELCFHRRAQNRTKHKIKLYHISCYYPEPLKDYKKLLKNLI